MQFNDDVKIFGSWKNYSIIQASIKANTLQQLETEHDCNAWILGNITLTLWVPYHKRQGTYQVGNKLLASQEDLCTMELVSDINTAQ